MVTQPRHNDITAHAVAISQCCLTLSLYHLLAQHLKRPHSIVLHFQVHSGTLVSSTLREWDNTGIQIDKHSHTLARYSTQVLFSGWWYFVLYRWHYLSYMAIPHFISTCCYLLYASFSLYRQSFTSSSSLRLAELCLRLVYIHVNAKFLAYF